MVNRFERAHLNAVTWKNGGGVTREIVRQPAMSDLDDFNWRASIATIAADGPFSSFAGMARVIVLLDGSPVRLQSTDGRVDHCLETLVPFAFDGETALACTVGAGTSSDFNLMARRDLWQIDVQIVRGAHILSAATSGVLFAARGAWEVAVATTPASADGDDHLPRDTGVWWHDVPCAWTVTPRVPDAALVAGRLWRRLDRDTP